MRTTPVRRLLQSVGGWGDCGLKHGNIDMMQNRTILRQSQFRLALLQNSVEHNLDRRRRERSEPGATTPRRMAMRHGGGRGAEEKVRGAEPSGGFAARRRKRAGRGYMLPLARVEHGLPLRQ